MDCPLLGRLSEPPPSKGQRMRKEEREARVFQEIFLLPRPGLGKEAREAVMDLHEEAKTPGQQGYTGLAPPLTRPRGWSEDLNAQTRGPAVSARTRTCTLGREAAGMRG